MQPVPRAATPEPSPSSGEGARAFVATNVVGGAAVLASYVLWLGSPSHDAAALWGSIGGAGRVLYTISMLTAAAGYFAFAPFLLRHGDRPPLSFHRVNLLLTLVLLPSALWMPLAFEYLEAPSRGLWWTMRTGLAITGLASAAIAHTIWRTRAPHAERARRVALLGALAFTWQTLILDALVWPPLFVAGLR